MNEQEIIQRKKIEKREKVDTILAYILIVILLAAILIVLYLKFIRGEEEETGPVEYKPNYITLEQISTSLNSSTLASRYLSDNATFTSSVSGNALVVTYTKENNNINLNIPFVGNELEVTIDNNNSEIIADIYKEIASIICTFYGNTEENCRATIDKVTIDNPIDGIRFMDNGENNIVYINIIKSVDVNSSSTTNNVYDSEKIVELSNTNYSLKLSDTEINNISVNTTSTDIKFTGNIKSLTEGDNILSVNVKLYGENDNVLAENKYEYTEEKPLNSETTFEVSFMLSDTLKLENVKKYSINVIR